MEPPKFPMGWFAIRFTMNGFSLTIQTGNDPIPWELLEMPETIRTQQLLVVTIAALIFGPIFMLGPVIGGICLLVFAKLSLLTVSGALLLCFAGGFIAYHMTQNFQWVEFDGTHIRGKRFWTQRMVENTLDDVRDIRVLGAVVKNTVTTITDEILGSVRGWEIRFHNGPTIPIVRHDMKNADEFIAAVQRALAPKQG